MRDGCYTHLVILSSPHPEEPGADVTLTDLESQLLPQLLNIGVLLLELVLHVLRVRHLLANCLRPQRRWRNTLEANNRTRFTNKSTIRQTLPSEAITKHPQCQKPQLSM